MTTLVFVGAGPRATGLLERIAANLPEFPQALDIHLVDPHPPGAGRVWRHAQSPLLRMNSMAEDVTMFTDESVVCEGPIRPGPSLYEWAEQVRAGGLDDEALTEQVRALRANSFPTRQLQSRYLEWVFDTVVKQLPDTVTVTVHPTTALSVTEGPDGRQLIPLADGETLAADVVVLTLGHLDTEPSAAHRELAKYAADNNLRYIPPEYAADTDLSVIQPGEHVVMRGFGLSFIDLMVLTTEGAAAGSSRTPPVPCGTSRRVWNPCCTWGRGVACRTTRRPTTGCSAAARRCRGSSRPTSSTRCRKAATSAPTCGRWWPRKLPGRTTTSCSTGIPSGCGWTGSTSTAGSRRCRGAARSSTR
ncbi:FAD/NAD(P)-binding protein [Kutzneria kofuensis]|uniref:FAD/NAD(P)-binding protein n=1 Tax=Kutzneria kofuensis TaxID=103725 RepID=UPI0031EEF431